MTTVTRIWAATATAGGTLAGATGLLARAALRQWRLVAGPSPTRLDEAVTLLAAAVGLVLCLWLVTSTVAALLAHLPGRLGDCAHGLAQLLAPRLTRRVAAVLVGAAVGGALAPATALGDGVAPAPTAGRHTVTSAATGARHGPGPLATAAGTTGAVAVPSRAAFRAGPGFVPTTGIAPSAPGVATGPGWTPTRPAVRPQVSPALVTASPGAFEAGTVVVHRGDTLWGLVRGQLGPGASDAEVAQAWPRWYAANRSTIGPDPGLILPGQVLHAPAPESMQGPG